LLDKLGVKPGSRVALVNFDEPWFEELLTTRTGDLRHGDPLSETDLVFLAADTPAELASLQELASAIKPNGAIWVVSRKGRAATLRYDELLAIAKPAGLVDNKVVSFSETQTALRFVIRVALRR
jgi:tRNA A58 N-methylase Trm61